MKSVFSFAQKNIWTGKNGNGFTLIELLVVIGIIGVLASIVLASLDSSRKKGRDARRLSDVKQIQLAMELYYDANNRFPSGTVDGVTNKGYFAETDLTGSGFISVVPNDPSTNHHYAYVPYMATGDTGGDANAVCISYHLGATLESTGHSSLSTDSDISQNSAGGSGGNRPPTGFAICARGTGEPANDFDGLSSGADCGGTFSNASAELCYDVRP